MWIPSILTNSIFVSLLTTVSTSVTQVVLGINRCWVDWNDLLLRCAFLRTNALQSGLAFSDMLDDLFALVEATKASVVLS